jgi:hypothetical protein
MWDQGGQEHPICEYTTFRKGSWIGHIWRRNCLQSMLLKKREQGREDEAEDISSYWIAAYKG